MTMKRATGNLKLVGGRLCLDFVNTVYARAVGEAPAKRARGDYLSGDDKLTSYPDLVAWGARAGLLADKEARRLLRAADDRPKTAGDRKSTRLNSSHANISYAVFCLKKKKHTIACRTRDARTDRPR